MLKYLLMLKQQFALGIRNRHCEAAQRLAEAIYAFKTGLPRPNAARPRNHQLLLMVKIRGDGSARNDDVSGNCLC